jgi:hypothetical protein
MVGVTHKRLDAALTAVRERFERQEKRIVNLEQQVANQAVEMQKLRCTEPMVIHLKGQAAAAQATDHLYAPLRSDTKPLLEMAAFVRKVAAVKVRSAGLEDDSCTLYALIDEAREILKRST